MQQCVSTGRSFAHIGRCTIRPAQGQQCNGLDVPAGSSWWCFCRDGDGASIRRQTVSHLCSCSKRPQHRVCHRSGRTILPLCPLAPPRGEPQVQDKRTPNKHTRRPLPCSPSSSSVPAALKMAPGHAGGRQRGLAEGQRPGSRCQDMCTAAPDIVRGRSELPFFVRSVGKRDAGDVHPPPCPYALPPAAAPGNRAAVDGSSPIARCRRSAPRFYILRLCNAWISASHTTTRAGATRAIATARLAPL
jgi:hypothetical protein